MPTDRAYTAGSGTVTSGNFETEEGIRARAERLIRLRRRRRYGSTDSIGSRLHELTLDSAENRRRIPALVREAWAPLLDSGEMAELEITVQEPGDGEAGFVFWTASYTDTTVARKGEVSRRAPWEA